MPVIPICVMRQLRLTARDDLQTLNSSRAVADLVGPKVFIQVYLAEALHDRFEHSEKL